MPNYWFYIFLSLVHTLSLSGLLLHISSGKKTTEEGGFLGFWWTLNIWVLLWWVSLIILGYGFFFGLWVLNYWCFDLCLGFCLFLCSASVWPFFVCSIWKIMCFLLLFLEYLLRNDCWVTEVEVGSWLNSVLVDFYDCWMSLMLCLVGFWRAKLGVLEGSRKVGDFSFEIEILR